jgi:hypothetical protein
MSDDKELLDAIRSALDAAEQDPDWYPDRVTRGNLVWKTEEPLPPDGFYEAMIVDFNGGSGRVEAVKMFGWVADGDGDDEMCRSDDNGFVILPDDLADRARALHARGFRTRSPDYEIRRIADGHYNP